MRQGRQTWTRRRCGQTWRASHDEGSPLRLSVPARNSRPRHPSIRAVEAVEDKRLLIVLLNARIPPLTRPTHLLRKIRRGYESESNCTYLGVVLCRSGTMHRRRRIHGNLEVE